VITSTSCSSRLEVEVINCASSDFVGGLHRRGHRTSPGRHFNLVVVSAGSTT
jgi:hypothetical protein